MWYKMHMNVLLTGARGSGKTTVGRVLAEQLNWPCVDLDDRALAQFAEPTVHAVWQTYGEAAWRDAEVRALQELVTDTGEPGTGRIVALGGGVPLIDEARALIEQAGAAGSAVVVYLQTSLDALKQRLSDDRGDRPSLTGTDAVEEMAAVLALREPTYRALADLIVTTHGRSPEDVAAIIAEWVRNVHTGT